MQWTKIYSLLWSIDSTNWTILFADVEPSKFNRFSENINGEKN